VKIKCKIRILPQEIVFFLKCVFSNLFGGNVTVYCDNDIYTHNCRFKVQHF
jgi:hypothetical protein